MRIEITLNENNYAIDVEGNCFTAVKFMINGKTGEQREQQLGYFNRIANCALRLCREELVQSPDTISLKQFASRVEAINKQLSDKLEAVSV